ncbi:granulin a isoform X10 [Megalobrama amblycephala]|uniref:granulin a isoform X10 n=1 Tax=Megalobrama amblycephala TaxID=75352 RepID=UPI0020147CCF|nr:granulin a isoform X10 [Megalobrama amblycephala]
MTDSYISQKLSSNKGGVEKCIYLRGNHFFIPASCGGTLRGDKIGNLDPTDPRTAHSLSAVYKPTYSLHKKMLRLTIALALVTLVASSQCPNNEVCAAGQSCCQDPTGEFSCCPFHHGECCEDHIHCCPEGMLCNVLDFKCVNATHTLPSVERIPAKQSDFPKSFRMIPSLPASEDDITCPDGSFCPAEFSCLLMASSYGCCPVAQGLVCSDGKHCCPKGHECSADSSSCVKQKEQVETVICGDGKSECPVDTTCCETEDGQWACCPMPKAVCCDDKIHCCPEDSVCDVESSKCMSSTNQELPMWAKFPARLRAEWEDHKPAEMRAEVEVTTTRQITTAGNQMTTLPGALPENSDVRCDETGSCPDGSTCCKTKEGGWACCPLPEAVCCDDFIHCCPHGTTCNVAAGSCDDPSGSTPWFEKLPVQRQNVAVTQVSSDVPCNDTAACPDGSTCCKTKDGGWACCPLPEAVCCEDFIHCCPHGKICNDTAGSCDDPSGSTPWLEKLPVQKISSQKVAVTQVSSNVPCDDTTYCPDGSTCCKTKEGGWACCPLPEAVCCEDFIHCCPHGTTCNDAAGSCDDPSGSTPWFEKLPVQRQNVAVTQVSSDVPCDDTKSCPDGSTCCKTKDGGWACCPLPEAVCCDDFIHCCPHGTTCNVAAGSCDDPSGSTPWLEKLPIQRQNVAVTQVSSDVPCDDTKSCPDGSTCCKTKDGGWACCPLPEAVCCDDFIHCCPHGTTCNVAAGSCDDPSGSTPWLEKVPARPRAGQRSTKNVNCDSSHICPESNTCCKNIDGDWGCCPMPEAVCCRDRFHCCPHGTTCNLVTLTCNGNATSVPMSVIISASDKEEQRQHKEVKEEVGKYIRVPCDAHTSCPDYTTCCLIAKTNKWGCCPLPNAVCCTDGEHCCPAYYKCDVSRVSCIKGDVVIPWYNKIAAQSSLTPNSDLNTNKCDEQSSCSTDSTCCRLTTGEWGCCPLPQAVCCPDQQHCCPRGYKCDLRRHSCIKTTWLYVERVPLAHIGGQKPQPNVSGKDIQCGGGYTCQDDQTCCPTSQTTWGCCPSSMAACCDDMKHCCPAGYKCGAGGICTPAVGFDWNNWGSWRVFFSKKKRATTL